MPQKAWSAKRERQYEHVKESVKEQGASAEEGGGDRRADGQQGARPEPARRRRRRGPRARTSRPGRRGGCAPGRTGRRAATKEQLYNEAQQLDIEGRSSMNKAAAAARGRPARSNARSAE